MANQKTKNTSEFSSLESMFDARRKRTRQYFQTVCVNYDGEVANESIAAS